MDRAKEIFIWLAISLVTTDIIFALNIAWARRVKTPYVYITAEALERSVSSWLDCGLPYATVSEISGIKLRRPLTVVKKETRPSTFYRHLACKLLEEYFIKKGIYKQGHIPVPVTQGETAYYYIFAEGVDHYRIEFRERGLILEEWDEFVAAFREAGFFPGWDTSRGDDGEFLNNIVFDITGDGHSWYRIDFEFLSFPSPAEGAFVQNKLWQDFLEKNGEDLRREIGEWKYRLLEICIKALNNLGKIPTGDENAFESLFFQYQTELLKGYLP